MPGETPSPSLRLAGGDLAASLRTRKHQCGGVDTKFGSVAGTLATCPGPHRCRESPPSGQLSANGPVRLTGNGTTGLRNWDWHPDARCRHRGRVGWRASALTHPRSIADI